ncbi:hypothetical protein AC578_5626 [Pseudocercospora eumusae]|uniref:Uncharacterized protein n=1 Tax=Pseudocercospora eumusae TaxID=321146 RepID=A0A139HT31_9PEZI|nr:hypothetical protein AC578_5626 [Pseudocercospora eumusae]
MTQTSYRNSQEVQSQGQDRRRAYHTSQRESRAFQMSMECQLSPAFDRSLFQAPITVYEQTPELNELHERLQTAKAGPRAWDGRRLRSMNSDEHEWAALAGRSSASSFDPGAAVFVPRARFGSTTTASVEGSTRNVPDNDLTESRDSLEAGVNLRLRSSFERNSQYHRRLDSRTSVASRNASVYAPRSMATQARRRSRNYEQNNTGPFSASGSERHSSTRAPPTSFAARRGSGSQRPVIFPCRDSSRRNLATFERSRRASGVGATSGITAASSLSVSLLNIPKDIDSGRQMPRSISPAFSTSSRSTPNLLRSPPHSTSEVRTRSNSFTWSQTGQGEVETATKSMRDISLGQHDQMPTINPDLLDIQSGSALDRLLNNQHSPLDELTQQLTQQLSRMNSGRPRSVGRSFERLPGSRPRISLLNGDPFRQDSSPERPSSSDTHDGYQTHYPPPSTSKNRDSILSTLSTDEDPVALSLALPSPVLTSPHQTASSPIHLPSTPATALRERAISSTSSTSISSPVRGSEWMSSGTRPTRPTATPRLTVYNDSRPADLQPQTPADIARSTARRRAGTASSHGSRASNTYTGSPAVPSSSNRHTYPAATPPQAGGVTPARVQVPSTGRSGVGVSARAEERPDENDVEEALDMLEEDRRVWMERREGGVLDTTPPAEGRFERYLE